MGGSRRKPFYWLALLLGASLSIFWIVVYLFFLSSVDTHYLWYLFFSLPPLTSSAGTVFLWRRAYLVAYAMFAIGIWVFIGYFYPAGFLNFLLASACIWRQASGTKGKSVAAEPKASATVYRLALLLALSLSVFWLVASLVDANGYSFSLALASLAGTVFLWRKAYLAAYVMFAIGISSFIGFIYAIPAIWISSFVIAFLLAFLISSLYFLLASACLWWRASGTSGMTQ